MLINTICEHLSKRIEAGELSNNDIVQIIEYLGGYLNLKTISDYSKEHRISYNGVKHFRPVRKLFNVKFVVDNL